MSAEKKKIQGRIEIRHEMCKACGYCIEWCPKDSIQFGTEYNKLGYYPAVFVGPECNGDAHCALVCPEGIIEVWRG